MQIKSSSGLNYSNQALVGNKLILYSISAGSFLAVISSGFIGALRPIGLFLILIAFFAQLCKYELRISKKLIISCLAFCITFAIGIIKNAFISDEHSEIYLLTLSLIFFFPLALAIYSVFGSMYLNDSIRHLSICIVFLFFTLFVLLFAFRTLFGSPVLLFLRNYSGGFYYRPLGIIPYYPLIWFQWSILAMPLAIWNLYEGNKRLFVWLALVVFLSLNRTGSVIIILFYLLSLLRHQRLLAKSWLYFTLLLPFVFLAGCVIMHGIYSGTFQTAQSGFEVRLGHVISVMNNMYNPKNLFFGMGADSVFVTLGRDGAGVVTNQEISFLEVLRRFGIVGYAIFNAGLICTLMFLYNRNNWPSFYSLLVYILFSFTNPCLISYLFVIFYAIIATTSQEVSTSNNSHF